MAAKIRLKRFGKKKAPFYRVVIQDSRTARNGVAIEEIGIYHPTANPSIIEINSERAQYWLSVGAQPTEAVAALLKLTGDWGKYKGDKDAKSTVKYADAKLSPEEQIKAAAADAEKLKAAKSAANEAKAAEKAAEEKAAADAKAAEEKAAADAAAAEAPAEEAPAADEAPAAEEAPAEEAAAEEAPKEEA